MNVLISFQSSILVISILWGLNGYFQSMVWANGIGACENYRETMKVYRLLEADDNFSIAFRESGHSHRPEDWTRSLDFAIEYFKPSK